MSDHPPIFEEEFQWARHVQSLGAYWEKDGDDAVCLDEDYHPDRILLACYQRCAWLDEARRVELIVLEKSDDPTGDTGWDDITRNQNTSALENAEAWRIWGEKK